MDTAAYLLNKLQYIEQHLCWTDMLVLFQWKRKIKSPRGHAGIRPNLMGNDIDINKKSWLNCEDSRS